MNGLLLRLAITAIASSLLSSTPTVAQAQHPQMPPARQPPAEIPPPAKKAARVEISQGPALELARDDFAIIRWITNNPGGMDEHFGVVHYGTDPKELSQTAQNPIRLNQSHPETTFRVQMRGLEPRTTYYYTVTSMESNGKSDGVKSKVRQFTTP